MKKITKIEASAPVIRKRKKVAAYARVSMVTERLEHSLSQQVSYYSSLIQKNPEWEYAGVYSDNGISGTSMAKRPGFNEMIADAENGKIDIILTKSISRFARNTVDCLKAVRHLKALGVSVRFERENIDSLSKEGELMLTLLASFAQEESVSISNNVKWGIRERMKQGEVPNRPMMLGYRWEGDDLVIVPEEAAIVKRIFQNFLDGKSRLETERELAAEGTTSVYGNRLCDSQIKQILTNDTYTGRLRMQKAYVSDPITKKIRINHGELPMYIIENHHEPIIDKETFDYVQAEMARRKELGALANKSLNTTCFTGKIHCMVCGKNYGRNQRDNRAETTSTYGDKFISWVCLTRKKKGGKCGNSEIPEKVLKEVCAEVLGLDEFNETAFSENVDGIDIDHHTLTFHLKDGSTEVRQWRSTAKSDCWTDEYKDRQRDWVRKYMRSPGGRFSPFTTRIICGKCGGTMRRQRNGGGGGNGNVVWRCKHGQQCGIRGIHENELMKLAADAMGIPEFDGDAFREQVDYATVYEGGRIIFTFTDGHEKEETYSTEIKRPKWSAERRARFEAAPKRVVPPEQRKAMSEKMKKIRSEKHWGQRK